MPRSWLWARVISREPRPTRPSTGSRACTGPTRTCSRIPRSTRSTSRCPTRCTCRGRCRRWRRASTCCARSRSRARPRAWSEAFDAAERAGRVLMEAFMWRFHPQTDELVRLVRSGAIGERARGAHRVRLRRDRRHRERAPADGARGRRADGRRVLLRQRAAAAVRRADAGERRAGARRRRRHRHPLRRHAALRRATSSARSTAAWTCTAATRSRSSARRARSSSPRRGRRPTAREILVVREDTERIDARDRRPIRRASSTRSAPRSPRAASRAWAATSHSARRA